MQTLFRPVALAVLASRSTGAVAQIVAPVVTRTSLASAHCGAGHA